jgi:cyclopropane-fatty-acyl-phospholipid synthase
MSKQDTIEVVGADRTAIEHHYDVGNDFYELWLDSSMTYSCALYQTGDESIDEAQRQKLEWHLQRLALPKGGSLLDVGCGWGSMLGCAASSDGALRLTGLTLSPAQAEVVTDRLGTRVDVVLGAWQAHRPAAPYDGIVSLGAFEHFVRAGLERPERIAGYQLFFRAASSWLGGPGRRLCLQTIALEDQEEQIGSGLGEFFTDAVFPASSLPRIGEIVDAAEPFFRLVELRADPDDYARTCRAWRRRLHAAREVAAARVGTAVVRHYRKLLLAAEMEFVTRSSTLYRLVFERRLEPVSRARGLPAVR